MLKRLYLLLFLPFWGGYIFAQNPAPYINAGQDTSVNCSNSCVNLHASYLLPIATDTYTVNTIPYLPYPMTGGTAINGVDDYWSSSISIPFDFCYFGNTFNRCIVGSNGQLSFNMAYENGYDDWTINTPLPSTINMPWNTICAVFRDINVGIGGSIKYYVTGTAPNRAFVVYWKNIPLYSDTAQKSTFELALHETTNIIDIYVQKSDTCSWNGGYGIIGIQNSTASTAIVPTGYNYPNTWSADSVAWRFTPSGTSINNDTIQWYNLATNTLIGIGDSVTVCPGDTTSYMATVIYTNCIGSNFTLKDTVTVNVDNPSYINIIPNDTTICAGDTLGLLTSVINSGGNYLWSTGDTSASIIVSPASTTTYTVTYQADSICTYTDSVKVSVYSGSLTLSATDTTICMGDNVTLQANTNFTGGSYLWSPGGDTSASINVTPYSTKNYIVTYSVTTCNSNVPDTITDTATVIVYNLPSVTVSSNSPICGGSSLDLMASGGGSYLWSGPNGFSSIQQNPVIPNATNSNSGGYLVTVTDSNGCHNSAITATIINSVDTSVTNNSPTLISNAVGATYQWLLCVNPVSPISGASSQSYTAPFNGFYAVAVTQNGCTDTSACIAINGLGIQESSLLNKISILPNPNSGHFSIDLGKSYHNIVITMTNMLGQIISKTSYSNKKILQLHIKGADGIYFIKMQADNEIAVWKIIKE